MYRIRKTEPMTRIFRGVGFANTGNDIQVAPGVVNSGIIADYTHTYDPGDGYLESCDLCPNATLCPHCPQFAATPTWTSAGVVENMCVSNQPNMTGKISADGSIYGGSTVGISDVATNCNNCPGDKAKLKQLQYRDKNNQPDCNYGCNFSNNDLRAECNSAVRPPRLHSGPPIGMFHKSAGFYDFLPPDTDCRSYNSRADEVLYNDVMNLNLDSEPASDECELFGINGYVYKEPCDMKQILDEQAQIMCKRSSSNRN